ncbi:MAG: alkaline shock response membrane anchor protein AmaP [Clostridia bacterium]|nr:alkaline shock response membrane anchor protein AmaP [Clostridia bacterium]
MKHPVLDRILILVCALCTLLNAAGIVMILSGRLSVDQIAGVWSAIDPHSIKYQIIMVAAVAVLVLFAILLIGVVLPGRRKRPSNFAIQNNENGMVRISVKALETLVQKVLDEHAEVKVVTSSIYSDEESVCVDLHISLQSDISMPLAISALQKQIKKYIESCSGVMVQEVRVYVDNTTPSTEESRKSPYAIPASLLWRDQGQLPKAEPADDAVYAAPMPTETVSDEMTDIPDVEAEDLLDETKEDILETAQADETADLTETVPSDGPVDSEPASEPDDAETEYQEATPAEDQEMAEIVADAEPSDDTSGKVPDDNDGASPDEAEDENRDETPLFSGFDSDEN